MLFDLFFGCNAQVRYRLYGEWDKDDECIPMVLAARQTAKVSALPPIRMEDSFFTLLCLAL